MQIQVRVRTNDVSIEQAASQLAKDSFILYDNCTEVKYGVAQKVSLEKFRMLQPKTIAEMRALRPDIYTHPEIQCPFDDVTHMLRDPDVTEKRLLEQLQKTNKEEEPYHYNVIEWKDRITNKRYRLIFDTVVFIMDDSGSTLRKVEG